MAESELEDVCQQAEKKLEMNLSAPNSLEMEGQKAVRWYRGLGHHTSTLGSCALRQGDVRSARERYAETALYAREYISHYVTSYDGLSKSMKKKAGRQLLRGLSAALVTGHEGLITDIGQDTLDLIGDYESKFAGEGSNWEYWKACFWQACTLASLCRDDLGAAEQYREKYFAVYDEQDHPITPALHEALFDGDQSQTRTCLQNLLEEHASQAADLKEWDEFVCRPAAAHLLVARDRGMDIRAAEFDSEYLPDALDEYDIGDGLELPHPEYVDEDLIPEA